MSVSTTSINSNESSDQIQCLLDSPPDDTAETRTDSQFTTESQKKDLEQTQIVKTDRNVSRNTGSWTVIDKNDLTSEEGVSEKSSESKNQSSNNDQTDTWKPLTPNNKNQDQGNSDYEPNKSGKFMSTLKRIRLGKRQVSEPGPPPRLISQVSVPSFDNYFCIYFSFVFC